LLDRSQIFDADLLSRIARREIPGPASPFPHRGAHRSPRRGASLEFSEHAEYTPGEDLRNLDWKVYAKTDRYFVKRHEDERLQRAVFVVDASGSMSYGAEPGGLVASKYHLAARITVALAACLLRQGDAVGVEVAESEERTYLPPRSGSAQLEALIEILGGAQPSGRAGLTGACRALGERLRRAASVFVVSDLLDEEEEDLAGVRELKARGLSPRIVHLLHAHEVDLPYENTTRFLDMEGTASRVIDPVAVRRAYAEEIREFVRRVARGAGLLGVPYGFCTTGEDPAPALGAMLLHLGKV
jgi:uncharacterized protein (DUF58 family)